MYKVSCDVSFTFIEIIKCSGDLQFLLLFLNRSMKYIKNLINELANSWTGKESDKQKQKGNFIIDLKCPTIKCQTN